MASKPVFPTTITPYDYLKIMALILMAIDHIGAYFYPEFDVMRALGRLCVPIWLFLIGYAHSRRIDSLLLLCAVLLTLLDILTGGELRSLNILWTIIALRLILNPLMRWIGLSEIRLLIITFLLFGLSPITQFYFNYGTLAVMLGIWGYLTRHNWQAASASALMTPRIYGAITMISFFYAQAVYFQFPLSMSFAVFIPGGLLVFYGLAFYLPQGKTGWIPASPVARKIISFIGHHTLLIYVLHMMVIYAILFFSLPLFSAVG